MNGVVVVLYFIVWSAGGVRALRQHWLWCLFDAESFSEMKDYFYHIKASATTSADNVIMKVS